MEIKVTKNKTMNTDQNPPTDSNSFSGDHSPTEDLIAWEAAVNEGFYLPEARRAQELQDFINAINIGILEAKNGLGVPAEEMLLKLRNNLKL